MAGGKLTETARAARNTEDSIERKSARTERSSLAERALRPPLALGGGYISIECAEAGRMIESKREAGIYAPAPRSQLVKLAGRVRLPSGLEGPDEVAGQRVAAASLTPLVPPVMKPLNFLLAARGFSVPIGSVAPKGMSPAKIPREIFI